MHVDELWTLEDLQVHRSAMRHLAAASSHPDPFSTLEVMENLVANEPLDRGSLRILGAFEGGDLVGYLPLRRVTDRILGKECARLEGLVTHGAARAQVVASPEDEPRCCQAFWNWLLANPDEWSMVRLVGQDEGSPLLPKNLDRRFFVAAAQSAPVHSIPLAGMRSLESFLSHLAKPDATAVRQSMRELMSEAKVQYLSSSDPAFTSTLLELFLQVDQSPAPPRPASRAGFLRGLLAPAMPLQLSVGIVLLDGVAAAGTVSGVYGSSAWLLETAQDNRFAHLRAGDLAFLLAVNHAISSECRSLTLTPGTVEEPGRWLARRLETQGVQVCRVHSRHFLKAVVDEARRAFDASTGGRVTPGERHEVGARRANLPPVFPIERARVAALVERLSGACAMADADLAARLHLGRRPARDPSPALARS